MENQPPQPENNLNAHLVEELAALKVSLAEALDVIVAQKEELEIARNQIDHYKLLWRTDSGLHRFWQ
jgi:DNA polymerase IIIc chi subunit